MPVSLSYRCLNELSLRNSVCAQICAHLHLNQNRYVLCPCGLARSSITMGVYGSVATLFLWLWFGLNLFSTLLTNDSRGWYCTSVDLRVTGVWHTPLFCHPFGLNSFSPLWRKLGFLVYLHQGRSHGVNIGQHFFMIILDSVGGCLS